MQFTVSDFHFQNPLTNKFEARNLQTQLGQTHHSKVHILQKTNTDFPGKFKGMQVSISSILCVQVIILLSLKDKFYMISLETFTQYKLRSCEKYVFVHGNDKLVHVVWVGRNDKSTLFFNAPFSIFGPLRRPQGQSSGRSRSLASLQIMFNLQSPQILNLNHHRITYFRHYVPWTKIPDDMNKFKMGVL